MWAFALWDEKKKELFCARDRFGIKPFYYTVVGGSFLFASEIKALLVHTGIEKTPDENMLGTYLAWGVHDHCNHTMFKGIYQIEPAHALVVTADGIQSPFRYWDVTINPEIWGSEDDSKVTTCFGKHLLDAVRIHLRSDVAVGTCLSGGIDSSTLTVLINSLIKDEGPESVGMRKKTFSVVFSDKKFDESQYIDDIIAVTGVDADSTEPEPGQLREDIDRLVYMQDEPFGSLSIYAQYCVMRLAKKKVTVVLDGQGADELLAGYLGYQGSYIVGLIRKRHWWTALVEIIGSIKKHRDFISAAKEQMHIRKKRRGHLKCSSKMIGRYQGTLDEVLHRELLSTNLPALLHYEDRNSMAFSLESRVPFLDVRLVEYIASLPLSQKIQGGTTKIVLRSAIRGKIPESVRCRGDKMGFVTPEECWMKNELRPFILELFSSQRFKSRLYWDAHAVLQDYQAFLNGKSVYSPEIWRIACAELWLRKFIDTPVT
jgi:asparagine synthase (glutamine-hydrolysing)